MDKVFCVRLLPGKGQRGPAFGGDRNGETCFALCSRGAVCSPSCFPDAAAFLGLDGDGTVILRDDGGNVLHRYRGTHGKGPGSEFALFPLGRFLCGLATGSDLMVPEHARCLSLAGTNLLLAFLLPGRAEQLSSRPLHEHGRRKIAFSWFWRILQLLPQPLVLTGGTCFRSLRREGKMSSGFPGIFFPGRDVRGSGERISIIP